MPRAYTISDVVLKDPDAADAYRTRAAASIAAFGGTYIVRSGTTEAIEGNWNPAVIVIAEFPDIATAKKWYNSPEYKEALKFRDKALSRNLILVEGVDNDGPHKPDAGIL
jgi:uncharacterized protein (DUF1330 family)